MTPTRDRLLRTAPKDVATAAQRVVDAEPDLEDLLGEATHLKQEPGPHTTK